MFAVIKTGGKQYKVQQGDVLQVEKLDIEKDKTIIFDKVLLVEDGKNTLIGTPYVDKAKVYAVLIETFKDDKVIVFKKKRRKQYKKMQGHRQILSRIKIEDITLGGAAPKKAKPAAAEKRVEPPKPKTEPKTKTKTEVKKTAPAAKAPAPKTKAAAPKPKAAASKPKTKAAPKKTAAPKAAATAKPVTKTKEK